MKKCKIFKRSKYSSTTLFYSYLNIKYTKFQLKNAQPNQAEIHIKNCLEKCAMAKISLKYHTKLKNMITLKSMITLF